MNSFEKIVLDNGLRIILVPQPQSLTATVLVLVEAGSKYEKKEINGLSHFLEHMCFKGTEKRPGNIDIVSELDSIGSQYNAFTGMEYTGYFAKAETRHLNKILELISDLYLNPVFNQAEINKERGVIIEEINMYEDLPMRRVQELFTNLLYGDQPAGWDIAGRKEVIQKLNREDFLKYRSEHYLSSATSIIVAGNFDKDEILKSVKNSFETIKVGNKIPKIKTTEFQNKPGILLKYKESDQTHLVLGVRAYDIFDKRRFALQLLTDILGGGMSSRLFHKIRDEMGAAYYVRAEAELMSDHGFMAVSAGVDHNKLDEVIKAILEEFRRLIKELIDGKTLQNAKDHLIGNLAVSLETSDELAVFYGGQEILTKNPINVGDLIKKIQEVKSEDIAGVAKDIFQANKLNLAIIGPFKDEKRFEKILVL